MTVSIGTRGAQDITVPGGPARKLRMLHFIGRSTTGNVDNAMFRKDEATAAVVDMSKGRVVTSSFAAMSDTGVLALTDTGGLGSDGAFTNHEMVALMLTDTGTLG